MLNKPEGPPSIIVPIKNQLQHTHCGTSEVLLMSLSEGIAEQMFLGAVE